eukprot:scaffold119413_cov74-Phaeocystis_antarctica.AAC.3
MAWALRARAPAASLRTSHVRHGQPRVEQRLIWRAAARRVGGWRPSVKARESGGGGAWRWRRVKGRGGAYGGRTRAQRSRRRRRASHG